MSFRSRALLTGVATGFLKATNDRRDKMAERMQMLADNKALMDRERAKSRADAASKAATAEATEWHSLRSNNYIDDEGNFQKPYYDKAAYAEFTKPEVRERFGNDFESFVTEFAKMQPKRFVRQYKDPNEIESSLQKVYGSIEARQQAELSRPVLTGFDAMLGSMVNRVSSAVGGKPVFGSDPAVTPEVAELETMTGAQPGPMGEYEAPKFAPVQAEEKFEHTFKQNEKGEWIAIFANDNKVKTQGTGIVGQLADNGTGKLATPKITKLLEPVYRGDEVIVDAYKLESMDDKGAIQTVYGRLNAQGAFVQDDKLTSKEVNTTGSLYPFKGEHNVKAVNEAMVTLDSAVSAHRSLTRVLSIYNPSDYGSERVFSDVSNSLEALTRITETNFSSGYKEQERVLNLIQKSDSFNSLAPELKAAIEAKDLSGIRDINRTYRQQQFDAFLTELNVQGKLTDEERELMSEIRVATLDAAALPIARDMLRAWTGGDKKPAVAAVQELSESLKAGSTSTKFTSKVEEYKLSMVDQAKRNLNTKWSASEYGYGQSPDKRFLELPTALQDKLGLPGTELRLNPKTGDFLLIKTGVDKDKNIVRFYLPSTDQAIYKSIVPKKGQELSVEEQDAYRYGKAIESEYTTRFNQYNRPY